MSSHRPILAALPGQLASARILLRRYADADAPAVCDAVAQAWQHLSRWLPGFSQPWSPDDALVFVRQAQARWALREAFQMGMFSTGTGALLGDLRLRPTDWALPAFDLAYWLQPAAEGHGYVSEAVRLATHLAFGQLGAQRLAICCDQRNARSRAVPERLGFALEGCLRNNARGGDGALFDMLVFALTPADYARVSQGWPGV